MPRRKPVLVASPPAPIDLNPRTDPPLDFRDKPYGEMTPGDYDALGFLCGLEVHQQLLTRRKLFCRCAAGKRSTRTDMEVLRHMRPTLSEMGQYDGTALMEFKTRKDIVYHIDRETVCTYELDDTPPFAIDEEAVKIAFEVGRLLGLSAVSELQVMRKQYLDGSIPTGFQRTSMIGLSGSIPLRGSELGPGRVLSIRQLTLEEDACREMSDVGHRVVFRPDRLGTPLIETVTEPELRTPLDVALAGRLIADVARATGKVRRGGGAGRQDVNVSIAGSRRVELKGVCHHKGLPLLVHNEAYRHLNLLRLRERLRERGVTAEDFAFDPGYSALENERVVDAARLVRLADYRPLAKAREDGHAIWAVRLAGFRGLLTHPTQPGRDFVHEVSERLRVIACLTSNPFLISSDERDLGAGVWDEVRRALRADDDDALMCVWGPERDVDTGVCEVLIRCADALVGVPSETRQSFRDGTTGFERILPGPDRMYPDTDTPAVPVPDAWHEEIELALRETPWAREDRYVASGLDARTAHVLSRAPWADLFDALDPRTTECRRRLACAFEKRLPHHRRRFGYDTLPTVEMLAPLVDAVDDGRMHASGFERALDRLLALGDVDADKVEQVIAAFVFDGDPTDEDEVRARVDAVLGRTLPKVPRARHGHDALVRWAMGRVMPRLLGEVEPGVVRERASAWLREHADRREPVQ